MAESAQISPQIQRELDRINQSINALRDDIKKSVAPPPKQFYRPSEVCKLLGISRSKFETWKNAGMFSVNKLGGSVYVPASDVERILPKSKQ